MPLMRMVSYLPVPCSVLCGTTWKIKAAQRLIRGWVLDVRVGGICPPECLCRRNGCQCGNIGVLSVLPLEILEQIIMYQDPVSLLALERSSRGMAKLVAQCWKLYCRDKNLLKHTPTPMCVGWKTSKDSNFSYDRATVASGNADQKWRLLAVRWYLSQQNICVGCQSNYGEFRLKDDVLLCYRCSKVFCLYLTQEVSNTLRLCGIKVEDLGEAFGPILIADLIASMRQMGINEQKTLKKIRPYLGCKGHSTCSLESLGGLPLSENTANGIYFIPQRGCVVTGPNTCSCLANTTVRERKCCGPDNISDPLKPTPRAVKIARNYMLSVTVLSFIHLMIISGLLSKHYSIATVDGKFEPFLQLACINGVLIIVDCLIFMFILKRLYSNQVKGKQTNLCLNLLQCLLLASLMSQITQIIMATKFAVTFNRQGQEALSKSYKTYLDQGKYPKKLAFLFDKYNCCLDAAVMFNNATVLLQPIDVSTSVTQILNSTNAKISSIICSSSSTKETRPECLSALQNGLFLIIFSFVTTSSLVTFAHIGILCSMKKLKNILYRKNLRNNVA